jgi:serine/threonine protein kinase/tetratricopeptide (TPR) repeat protein
VLERLGAGGMGEVYLAEDLRLHRPVALKVLRPEADRDEQARERLLREARVASGLNHPNIAVIYDIGELPRETGPLRYIAMEFVAGRTLADIGRRDPPDLDSVLDMVRQTAEALAEAHAHGIVHRDVKPSNVMVTESGRVKVLDFGLAREQPPLSDADPTWTRDAGRLSGDGALVGTLAYMSPEQALGQGVDARADVFSLGAVLYELLAGRAPFAGRNAVRVLDALLHHDPPPLSARVSDPRLQRVEAILGRMLAKDPDRRYPGMRELIDDLEAVRQGAPPPSIPVLAPPSRSVAVMGFSNITGSGEDDWLGTGLAETVTTDLKGIEGLAVISGDRIREALRRLGADAGETDEAVAVRAGRDVGARWVLLGGFQRSGDAIRVTARLTEVATGAIVDTVKVDGTVAGIFDLQDRIVRELTSALRVSPARSDRAIDETSVIEAYEAFSRGVINLRVETYESLDRAVLLFEQAVRLDPAYARAHMELGVAYSTKADYLAIPQFHERALASLQRALELKPDLVRAWREMGGVLVSLGRAEEGIPAIRKALELDPDDAGALGTMGRAHFVGLARFREAAEFYEKALLRNPQGGWYALQLSHCLALMRELERAEAAARRAVELQEALLSGQEGVRVVGAYMRLGHVASLRGQHGEAAEQYRRELAFLQRVDHALRSRIFIELHMRLGAAHLRLGQAEEAWAALEVARDAFEQRVRLGADDPFTRYYGACAYALRGETEEALACLAKAIRMRRAFNVARARIEPELDALRGDARLADLLGSDPGPERTERAPQA